MRPPRSALLPAGALCALSAGVLVVGLATQAMAAPTLAASPVAAGLPQAVGAFAQPVPGSAFPAGIPGQVVSDAAFPDPMPAESAIDRAAAVSRSRPVDRLGTAAVTVGSPSVRIAALQERLVWVGATELPTTGIYASRTQAAVAAFQAKHELPVTGSADASTVAELARVSARGDTLDPRCTSVPVAVCVDKTQKVLRYVVDGRVVRTLDANFGPEKGEKGAGTYSRTREGSFTVYRKSANHVSSGYGTPMKWSLFFDGAEAMHFSDYFRRGGYSIRSFGCVDIGDLAGARWVYNHSPIGTPFIVYH